MRGLSTLEVLVAIAIMVIFFTMATTMVAYFYQFPPFDVFKDSAVYRNLFFELSKTIKEADSIKNIYSNEAIYIQVKNNIYAYRLNKSTKKVEKSVDGGYTWFYLPNVSNIEAINFRAPVPYSSAKILNISFRSFYPVSKLSKYHQFILKIRKEEVANYVIAGINPSSQIVFSLGALNNWSNFTTVSNKLSLSTLNLDTFVGSYNVCAPTRFSTSNYQLWRFTKQSPNSSFSYEYLDTISSFDRVTTTTPGIDNDWLKVVTVGDYIYTAYAVLENLYTSSSGIWEQYYSVYFAYRKMVDIVTNYGGNHTKSGWLKRKIFSLRRGSIANGNIRFVRFTYGQAAGNKFHITFCVGDNTLNPNINDFYYAGSPDGINWNIKNIDDSLGIDNLNPLFVIPLVGKLDGTTNFLHFVFVNYISSQGNNRFNISYLTTNDLVNFSPLQNLNINPTYRGIPNRSFNISVIKDFEALLYDGSIHLVFSIQGIGSSWNGNRDKLIYMVKQNFNDPAVYNIHPSGVNASINFSSNSISIGDGYVHIIASNSTNLYYIRETLNNSLIQDFLVNLYNQGFSITSVDTFYRAPYLYVSFYLSGGNNNTNDLGFVRITNPNNPSIQSINNLTIDDNLVNSASSVDGNILLSSDNVTNGVMSGLTIGSKGYLHFVTFCQTANSLAEVIYTDPANPVNGPLPHTARFDTLLIHQNIPYYRSVSSSDDGSITYSDNNSTETTIPTAGRINDLKIYHNGFITEIDGNRRFDTNNATDIAGSRSCGFYNDIQKVNDSIYVAYSELIERFPGLTLLRLRLAKSEDKGQSWIIETVNSSNSARDINLQIKGNIINIVHRNVLNNLVINKKISGSWIGYSPSIATNNFNIRTFLDSQNRLHILSFSSSNTNVSVNKIAYYRVFDNYTNTFLNTGLVGDSLLSVPGYLATFSSIGPYGDILVDNDGTVFIVVNTRRILEATYGLDLLVYKNGQWQNPIRIPPHSPINYLLTSLRINKW